MGGSGSQLRRRAPASARSNTLLNTLRRERGQSGAVATELVVATPLLMLMLLAIVQFALWSHATHIAQAAAAEGLATTRQNGATAADGEAAARDVLDELARGPLETSSITVRRDSAAAFVQVRGTASPVVPFLVLPVHAEATGPVERFVPNLPTG